MNYLRNLLQNVTPCRARLAGEGALRVRNVPAFYVPSTSKLLTAASLLKMGLVRTAGGAWVSAGNAPKKRHFVSLSSGASSAVAAQRAIDKYGRENVELVFADTLWEDDDNYRFLWQLCERWGSITILMDGRNPLQVAKDKQIIPNQKFAPCTAELKIKLFVDYLKQRQAAGYQVAVILGMGWNEQHRMEAPTRNYGALGIDVIYPLVWSPVELDSVATVKAWGIEPPRMYQMGYKHANCGGRCIKQGKRDWRRTLENFPERFAGVESWEREMRQDDRFAEYAILRDETGGEVKAYTLEQLRLEVQARDSRQPRLWDIADDLHGCSVECGASDPGNAQEGQGRDLRTVAEVDREGEDTLPKRFELAQEQRYISDKELTSTHANKTQVGETSGLKAFASGRTVGGAIEDTLAERG